ncbi:MAG: O-antigen ligase family protein [Acidobacteria bacterium]|nr:O-antigen ligase family protein [Acidobacteriota bacterium]
MPLLATLIPGIICIIVLLRSKTQDALLDVVLPVLLLVPVDFYLRIRPLPPLNMIDAVLLPLGIGMLIRDLPRWRFSRADLWLAIYIFSYGYADRRMGQSTASIFRWFIVLTTGLVPYMAGKLLIEQNGIRAKTVKRFISLLCIASIFSMYEYVKESNPFQYFWGHFYPGQWSGWITQTRWGFGRVAGPYAQSELAGMILLTGLLLTLWLGHKRYRSRDIVSLQTVTLKHVKLVTFILFITLGMTQARGPWLGTVIALPIAWIGLARFPKRRALFVFVVGFAVGIPAYIAGKDYASGRRTDYGSEKETAQYRAELIDNYIPIAQQGGAWGWGPLGFPRINGQVSIDNEYLLTYLAQGYVGLTTFILLLAEAAFALMREGFRTKSIRDRHFIFSMLAVVAGISFTLGTVYLGAQSYEVLFLLIGWSQSIRGVRRLNSVVEKRDAQLTRDSLIRVYT